MAATGRQRAESVLGQVRQGVLSAARRVRTLSVSRRVGDALVDRQYRVGNPGGAIDRSIARAVVYDIIPVADRARSVDELVEFFFELVEAAEVEQFIEAGAKDASASVRAATQLGLSGVVAFEANPYTHRRFNAAVSAHGVTYEHRALSETSGEIEFLVRLNESGEPSADGQGSLLVRPDHTPGYETVVVDSVRLDEYFASSAASSCAMWVDVEGASSQVLRGARQLLAVTDVVMIEVEERQSWVGQEWLHMDVVNFFAEFGLVPIARDTQSRRQFNVVFVSTRAAERAGVDAVISRRC